MTTAALDGTGGNPPPTTAAPGTVAPLAASQVGAAAPRRHAPETARLYAADWTAFASWCADTGRSALPAAPATVAAFLAATGGKKRRGAGLPRRGDR
jgi:hypothetical protein